MSRLQSYEVTFWVRDKYSIVLDARSPFAAINKAVKLYHEEGEAPFTMSITEGGAEMFEAEPIERGAVS